MKIADAKDISSQGVVTNEKNPVPSLFKNKDAVWLQRYLLITRQPFFNGMKPEHLGLLTDDALEMEFAAGQQIFVEGSPANRFFLILEGEVELQSENDNQEMIPFQKLGPGEDLGWSWLFAPYTLHFGARAIKRTRTIFFFGTRLRERCETDHDFGYEILKRVAEVMLNRLQTSRRQLREQAPK